MNARVLLVALEGADPGIVSPLVDRGALPTFARVIERGAFGALHATPPLVRAMTWTTLATGVQAPDHGVCADAELRGDGAGTQPASHAAWLRPSVWERLASSGHRSLAIGWPATAPATSWPDVCVDDRFAQPRGIDFDAWPLLPDCVSPTALRDELRSLRVHPSDITTGQIVALVPHAGRVDQDRDTRLARLAGLLARSSTVHAAATHLVETQDWSFAAIAYPLLGDGARAFGRFRAPRLADVSDDDGEIYGGVVDSLYRLQDAMLARLLALAGDDVTVVIASPYAIASGADRPDATAAKRLPPSVAWHRPRGFIAAAGPGIAHDMLVHGANVEDVAATLLARFGIRDERIDGRAIASMLFDASDPARPLAPAPRGDASIAGIEIAEDLDDARRSELERVRVASLSNAAEAYLARGDVARAVANYEAIVEGAPDDWVALARLARCRLALRQFAQARALAGRVAMLAPQAPWGALLLAAAHVLQGEREQAIPHLAQAGRAVAGHPQLALRVALLYLACDAPAEAEALFRSALARLPQSAEAFDGLGCALHAQQRYDEAEAAFRSALGCNHRFPIAHLHLAHALLAQGRRDEATRAADLAQQQDPDVPGLQVLRKALGVTGARRA